MACDCDFNDINFTFEGSDINYKLFNDFYLDIDDNISTSINDYIKFRKLKNFDQYKTEQLEFFSIFEQQNNFKRSDLFFADSSFDIIYPFFNVFSYGAYNGVYLPKIIYKDIKVTNSTNKRIPTGSKVVIIEHQFFADNSPDLPIIKNKIFSGGYIQIYDECDDKYENPKCIFKYVTQCIKIRNQENIKNESNMNICKSCDNQKKTVFLNSVQFNETIYLSDDNGNNYNYTLFLNQDFQHKTQKCEIENNLFLLPVNLYKIYGSIIKNNSSNNMLMINSNIKFRLNDYGEYFTNVQNDIVNSINSNVNCSQ